MLPRGEGETPSRKLSAFKQRPKEEISLEQEGGLGGGGETWESGHVSNTVSK